MTGSSDAKRNAKAGGKIAGGTIGANFSSGGDGTLGGLGVGPLEFNRRRFGELSALGEEDRREGDGVPGDPGREGAQTICSGVVERILFSFSCSSVTTDSGDRRTLRSSGVTPPSLDGSRGRLADFNTSVSFPSELIFDNARLIGWNVPFGNRKHGVSGSGSVAPGRVLAPRSNEYGTMRIGFVGNASAYWFWFCAGGVAPGDGGADPEVAEPPRAAAKACFTTCLVLQ